MQPQRWNSNRLPANVAYSSFRTHLCEEHCRLGSKAESPYRQVNGQPAESTCSLLDSLRPNKNQLTVKVRDSHVPLHDPYQTEVSRNGTTGLVQPAVPRPALAGFVFLKGFHNDLGPSDGFGWWMQWILTSDLTKARHEES